MADPEKYQERLQQFKEGTAPLREGLPGKAVEKLSQWLRAKWIKQPGIKDKDPKDLGREMETVDLWTPVAHVFNEVVFGDPEIAKRFFDKKDPRPWEEKALEFSVRYGLEIERGEKPDRDRVRAIVEQALSEEPPPEVKERMEMLRESPYWQEQ